ncbi:MAG: mandelate racemase/muconate lactonizing enzyme family protein [Candidatus Bathyarchaeia archaeon]
MRITRIEVVQGKRPIILPEAWRPAWQEPDMQPVKTTEFGYYRVHTDEGIVGIGPSWGRASSLAESTLLGEDPAYVERFWEVNMRGRGATLGSASCGGLEIALWDIVGKAAGKPVYKLLGAYRDKVMAYAATAQLHSPEEHAKEAVQFREIGIRAIKLRMHRPKPDQDLEVVKAVRDAVGEDMTLLVDANQNNESVRYDYWSRRTALKVAKELENLGVYWLEEPLPRTDLEGLAELSAEVEMYIAGGEHATNIYEFRDALFQGAYDIVQPDVVLGNIGITGIRKIAVLADALGRLVVPHVCSGGNNGLFLAATLQAVGTVPNCPFIEYPLEPPALTHETQQAILKEPLLIDRDGFVQIPQKPGIGVEIDEEKVARYM